MHAIDERGQSLKERKHYMGHDLLAPPGLHAARSSSSLLSTSTWGDLPSATPTGGLGSTGLGSSANLLVDSSNLSKPVLVEPVKPTVTVKRSRHRPDAAEDW